MFKKAVPKLPEATSSITSSQIIKSHELLEKSRKQAVAGLPAQDQATIDPAECEVQEVIEQRSEVRNDVLAARYAEVKAMTEATTIPSTTIHDHQIIPGVINETIAVYRAKAGEIIPTVRNLQLAQAQYNAFRDEHGLTERPAIGPTSLLLHFAIVLIFLLLEAAANSAFFMQVSANGLIGGFLTAFAIAAVNVATGCLLGYGPFRYFNHRNKLHWLWAVPSTVLLSTLIFYVNFFAAHYREAAATAPASPDKAALTHLVSQPLDLSLNSFLLFIFGVIIGAVAVFKGYGASDPYPGYSKVTHTFEQATDEYTELQDAILSDLDGVNQAQIVPANTTNRTSYELIDKVSLVADECRALRLRFDELTKLDILAAERAVEAFRQRNLEIRTDGIHPQHFREPLPLQPRPIPVNEYEAIEASVDSLYKRMAIHLDLCTTTVSTAHAIIETAKDSIDETMALIEASALNDDVPKLAVLREKLEAVPRTRIQRPAQNKPQLNIHDIHQTIQ